MIRDRALQTREKLVGKLPVTGELLRGSLLERTVRHKSGCPKCARGEGHQVYVLTVSYAGGRMRQFSVRRERVAEVRRWLDNYQKLKEAIEAICELNHDLLRPEGARGAGSGGRSVIEMRRAQLSFGDGLIAEEVSDLREGWMEHADRVLADEQIVAAVYEALARRHPKSRSRGRLGAPAEVVLRLLILKHVRNWSYHGAGARSARQSGVSRLHARGRRQDAGRQDHGALGLGCGAGGDQAGSRPDGANRAGAAG